MKLEESAEETNFKSNMEHKVHLQKVCLFPTLQIIKSCSFSATWHLKFNDDNAVEQKKLLTVNGSW